MVAGTREFDGPNSWNVVPLIVAAFTGSLKTAFTVAVVATNVAPQITGKTTFRDRCLATDSQTIAENAVWEAR